MTLLSKNNGFIIQQTLCAVRHYLILFSIDYYLESHHFLTYFE